MTGAWLPAQRQLGDLEAHNAGLRALQAAHVPG